MQSHTHLLRLLCCHSYDWTNKLLQLWVSCQLWGVVYKPWSGTAYYWTTLRGRLQTLKWDGLLSNSEGSSTNLEVVWLIEQLWGVVYKPWSGMAYWTTVRGRLQTLKWYSLLSNSEGSSTNLEVVWLIEQLWGVIYKPWSGTAYWATLRDCLQTLKWHGLLSNSKGLSTNLEVVRLIEQLWRIVYKPWSGTAFWATLRGRLQRNLHRVVFPSVSLEQHWWQCTPPLVLCSRPLPLCRQSQGRMPVIVGRHLLSLWAHPRLAPKTGPLPLGSCWCLPHPAISHTCPGNSDHNKGFHKVQNSLC